MVKVNTSESRPEGGGDFFDQKCDCHFIVEGWEDHSGKQKPYIEVTVLSLASTVASQVGKKRTENFSLHPKAVGKLCEFACAVGIYTKDQWKKDKENGINPDLDLDAAIGKTFCAPIGMVPFDDAYWTGKLQEYQQAGDTEGAAKAQEQLAKNKGRSFPQLGGDKGFTFWALGDPAADHVPLDEAEVAQFGGELPTNNGGRRRRGTAAPAATVSKPAPAPAAATPPASAASFI